MKLSVVTDEISADLETALELAKDWGAEGVEVRGVWGGRYPDVGEMWRRRVPELVQEAGLPVAAISPGLFKIPLPSPQPDATKILRWEDAQVFEAHQRIEALADDHLHRLLPAAIEAAQRLDCRVIVAFSFETPSSGAETPEDAPQMVVDVLRDAADQTASAGITLAIEVEHVCWGRDAKSTNDLIRRVGRPGIGINWDPANAFAAGEEAPYPSGWAILKEQVRHVHFKQARRQADGAAVFDTRGVIDWNGQIRALVDSGYQGWVSVETHARPKVASARAGLLELQHLRMLAEEPE
ncbi:MAG TPA: sugar phosphate isomerase/epimerase family protein [Candidatus Dormibacteraeota bacterium]|nr:sugar phosphate isomerase/epimerase family protein [Candidatus Dormibacteraeota bacterium]